MTNPEPVSSNDRDIAMILRSTSHHFEPIPGQDAVTKSYDVMNSEPTRWTADRAGCIFAGSSTRTSDDLNAAVVLLACQMGWTSDGSHRIALDLYDGVSSTGVLWCTDIDDSDCLSDGALAAQEWLNEHIAPDGYYFEFDDGFYLVLSEPEDL